MGNELRRLKKRKRIQEELEDIVHRENDVLIIHYSCESFYDADDGRSPRVTSIAVRNFGSG